MRVRQSTHASQEALALIHNSHVSSSNKNIHWTLGANDMYTTDVIRWKLTRTLRPPSKRFVTNLSGLFDAYIPTVAMVRGIFY